MSNRQRQASRVLDQWKLWDRMDAILSIGVTKLVDQVLDQKGDGGKWPATEPEVAQIGISRKILLLAACYDESTAKTSRSVASPASPRAILKLVGSQIHLAGGAGDPRASWA